MAEYAVHNTLEGNTHLKVDLVSFTMDSHLTLKEQTDFISFESYWIWELLMVL